MGTLDYRSPQKPKRGPAFYVVLFVGLGLLIIAVLVMIAPSTRH